jgi:hypothetical protein
MTEEYLLSSEQLDNIYDRWIKDQELTHDRSLRRMFKMNYQRQGRNTLKNQRFEEWLWGQGFKVIQRDGSRYLKFIGDEKRLTWFLLKHGELQ